MRQMESINQWSLTSNLLIKRSFNMDFYVNQSIIIQYIKIGGISNSSVFQIGSAGIIKPHSYLSNTGAFTKPAPQADKPQPLPPSVPLTT